MNREERGSEKEDNQIERYKRDEKIEKKIERWKGQREKKGEFK